MRKSILQNVVLENFEEEVVIDAPVEDTGIETELGEVADALEVTDAEYDQGEANFQEIEDAEATVADMEGVADATLTELEDENWEGHDAPALESLNALLTIVERYTGIPTQRQIANVAKEDFEGASHTSRREKSRVAAEGIKDLAKKAYEAFKKAMNTAFEWIKRFVRETFTRVGRAEASVRKAADKLKEMPESASAGELIESPAVVLAGFGFDKADITAENVTKAGENIARTITNVHTFIDDVSKVLTTESLKSIDDYIKFASTLEEGVKRAEKLIDLEIAFGSKDIYAGGYNIEWEESKGKLGFKYAKLVLKSVPAVSPAPKTKVPTKKESEALLEDVAKLLKTVGTSNKGIVRMQEDIEAGLKRLDTIVGQLDDENAEGAKAIDSTKTVLRMLIRLLSSEAALLSKLSLAYSGSVLAFVNTTGTKVEKKEEEKK